MQPSSHVAAVHGGDIGHAESRGRLGTRRVRGPGPLCGLPGVRQEVRLRLVGDAHHRGDFEATLKNWESLRSELQKETRPSDVILQILQKAGAPTRWSQLEPAISEDQARFAFFNASLMRKRLTLGDILIFTHWDRERLWDTIWKLYA